MDKKKKGTEYAQQATRDQRRAEQNVKKTDRKEEVKQAARNKHIHEKGVQCRSETLRRLTFGRNWKKERNLVTSGEVVKAATVNVHHNLCKEKDFRKES